MLFLLALCAHLAVNPHREQPRFTVPDSGSYIQAAASLLENGAFLDQQGNPSWERVPGYPVPLAAGMAVSLGGLAAVSVIALHAHRWGFERQALFVMTVLVVLYHIALSSLVGYQGERYRVPIISSLAVLLAVASFEGVRLKRWSE